MHFISLKMWLVIVKFGRSGDDIIILHCKLSIVAIFKNLTWQICQNSGEILFIYKVLSIQKDGGLLIFILALTQDSQSDSLRARKKAHVFT